MGGGFRGLGQCPKENVFFELMSSLITEWLIFDKILSFQVWPLWSLDGWQSSRFFLWVSIWFKVIEWVVIPPSWVGFVCLDCLFQPRLSEHFVHCHYTVLMQLSGPSQVEAPPWCWAGTLARVVSTPAHGLSVLLFLHSSVQWCQ